MYTYFFDGHRVYEFLDNNEWEFFSGKSKECYSCIVDSEDHNKTSLSDSIASIALVVGDTIPNEYCNISKDLSNYITCSTPRFCVRGVVESKSIFQKNLILILKLNINCYSF